MKTAEEFLVKRFDEDGIAEPPKHVYESITKVMEEFAEAKAGQYETIVSGTAADEWQTGEPEESGRYLVEYQQGERIKKVFVMDYDAFEERWLTHAAEAEVLRWAKINSEYQ